MKDVHSVPEIDKFKEGRNKSGDRKAAIHNKREPDVST